MSRSVAYALGLGIHEAGQTMAGRSSRKVGSAATIRSLFGVKGAGDVLAATQTMAQYKPPPQNPPIGSMFQGDPSRDPPPTDPATRQGAPASPNPQTPQQTETEGDRGKLSTPVLVGGFLILLVALYFIAK